jgi:hypothetical protein
LSHFDFTVDRINTRVYALRVREKAHTREGDAFVAARGRLPITDPPPASDPVSKPDAPTTSAPSPAAGISPIEPSPAAEVSIANLRPRFPYDQSLL